MLEVKRTDCDMGRLSFVEKTENYEKVWAWIWFKKERRNLGSNLNKDIFMYNFSFRVLDSLTNWTAVFAKMSEHETRLAHQSKVIQPRKLKDKKKRMLDIRLYTTHDSRLCTTGSVGTSLGYTLLYAIKERESIFEAHLMYIWFVSMSEGESRQINITLTNEQNLKKIATGK